MTTQYDTPPLGIDRHSDLSDWDEGEARAHGWPESLIADVVHEIGRRERVPNSQPRDYYQPTPADIQTTDRIAELRASADEAQAARLEAVSEIARLTRELREMTADRDGCAKKWTHYCDNLNWLQHRLGELRAEVSQQIFGFSDWTNINDAIDGARE